MVQEAGDPAPPPSVHTWGAAAGHPVEVLHRGRCERTAGACGKSFQRRRE